MIKIEDLNFESKSKLYSYLNLKITGLVCEKNDWLASLANISATLWILLKDINWVGFYLYKNEELILGPFQGKPACTNIAIGKGVCGTAASKLETQLVKNVHEFEGHIACDSDSKSEIVLPIVKDNKLIGVLDIDSPIYNRFDEEDKLGLEKLVEIMTKYIVFPNKFV